MELYDIVFNDYMYHEGVKGQEWGKRQYQYEDGSLTPLGRIHYGVGKPRAGSTDRKEWNSTRKAMKKEERLDRKNANLERKAHLHDLIETNRSSYKMSDAELRRHIDRLRNEKTLSELTDQYARKGRTTVLNRVDSMANTIISSITTAVILGGIKYLGNRAISGGANPIDRTTLANWMFKQ